MTEFVRDSFPCPVAAWAGAHPNGVALVTPTRSFSYADLDREVSKVAGGLLRHGAEPGKPVAAWLPDDWRYPILVWALIRLGVPLLALNRREPIERLRSQASLVGCNLSICDTPGRRICETELVWESISSTPAGVRGHDSILSHTTPATIMFTSGSTGMAKAVLLTLGNHWYNAAGSQSNIPVDTDVRWMVALPFFHVGGLSIIFRCFLHGGCVVLKEDLAISDAFERLSPTHVSLVPTQLLRLLDGGNAAAVARLKCVLVGGARVPSELISRACESGVRVRTTYGLTEMASQVTTTQENAHLEDLATSGKLLPYREIRVSETGGISVRGKTLFAGYVGPAALEIPFDSDGWFETGDVGILDRLGRLTVLGRRDTMFVSGGENVYPEEIEEAIVNTGLVEQCIVVPVEDDQFGTRGVAFVSPMPDIDRLVEHLRSAIAGFKVPVRFLGFPPDFDGMKVSRDRLAALAARGREH